MNNKAKIIDRIKSVLIDKGNSSLLIRGGVSSFVIKIFGAIIVFAVQVLIARLIGAKDYGVYNLALSWINILVLFCLLGMDIAFLKFIPIYQSSKDWRKICGLLKKGNQIILLMSFLVCGISIFTIWEFSFGLSLEVKKTFITAFLILPVIALNRLRSGALRAFKFSAYSLFPQQVFRPLILGIGALILFSLVSYQLSSFNVMVLNFCAMFLVFLISDFWLHKNLPFSFAAIVPAFKTKEWMTVSLPLLLISGMELLLKRIDILMIGAITGSKAAGIYSADIRISSFITLGLASLNIIAAPIISQLYAKGKLKELQRVLYLAAKCNFLFIIPVVFLMLLLGESILKFFGSEFVSGYSALVILIVGQVINSMAGPVGLLMTMTGRQTTAAKILGITVIANIAMNLLFITIWGITGAALATSGATLIWNIGLLKHIHKNINLYPTIFYGFKRKNIKG